MLFMPKFLFRTKVENDLSSNEISEEFTDLAAARMKALEIASKLILQDLKENREVRQGHIEISDEDGNLLSVVPLIGR